MTKARQTIVFSLIMLPIQPPIPPISAQLLARPIIQHPTRQTDQRQDHLLALLHIQLLDRHHILVLTQHLVLLLIPHLILHLIPHTRLRLPTLLSATRIQLVTHLV